ncbi:hypothetical protein NQ317_004201 [Molorchus minor]|uniref:Uncharacterized protein n=1 Tax=Molorchus minor TaxID=1323400 RepID=A0ABQ9IW92_9CUCU|nr:hypothetical protein NQ317_004201 [Molorchus minor]
MENRFSKILGAQPLAEKPFGTAIHEEVSIRWNSYVTKGVDKKIIETVTNKYMVPENSKSLGAPIMNKEVEICLSRDNIKNDRFLSQLQNILGSSLTAVGTIMSEIITNPTNTDLEKVISTLADSAQLQCAVHQGLSQHRRYPAKFTMTEESHKVLGESPIDELLFGKNLNESIKTNEATNRLGKTLKQKKWQNLKKPSTYEPQPGPSGMQSKNRSIPNYLNYRRPQNTSRKRPRYSENIKDQERQRNRRVPRFRKY